MRAFYTRIRQAYQLAKPDRLDRIAKLHQPAQLGRPDRLSQLKLPQVRAREFQRARANQTARTRL